MSTMLTGYGSATTTSAQDFWLLYAAEAGSKTLGDVLHALYYLPGNYKLLVLTEDIQDQMYLTAGTELFGRVRYETEAGLSDKTSPFFHAGAIIYASEGPSGQGDSVPIVITAAGSDQGPENNEWNGFTIASGSPEAMASAILRIARANP